MFKPTYIYIKTCNHCGLKYLGKSCDKRGEGYIRNTYKGSGTYWNNHIDAHKSNISTTIINYFREDEKKHCIDFCLFISRFFDIVKSKRWANWVNENGIDGGDNYWCNMTEDERKIALIKNGDIHRGKIPYDKGKKGLYKHTEESKRKISKNNKGKGMHGKKHTEEAKLLMSQKLKGKLPWNTGKKLSEEMKRKMSESHKGKKLSEEHKKNIRKALTGKKRGKYKKKIKNLK